MQLNPDWLKIISLLDLTSLNDNDNKEKILELCHKTKTCFGSVPAICIFSAFIPVAKTNLNQYNPLVKTATVANFPHGHSDFELAMFETQLAIERGADEVDIVFPYHALINGDDKIGTKIISEAKNIRKHKTLKVIIESGELNSKELIQKASEVSIMSGADFIKTSTGKVRINATIEAAKIMLNTIKTSGRKCGFKASGGIKTVDEAIKYLKLAEEIMGKSWISPETFRFGASGLLTDTLNKLNGTASQTNSTY